MQKGQQPTLGTTRGLASAQARIQGLSNYSLNPGLSSARQVPPSIPVLVILGEECAKALVFILMNNGLFHICF